MSEYVTYPGPTVLEIYRDLPGPIERVWDYLTKSELRQTWICAGSVSAEIGGPIEFSFDHTRLSKHEMPEEQAETGEDQMVGIIRVYEPPHKLAFSWPSGAGEAPTEVVIRLTKTEHGVRLHLRHEKLHRNDYKSGASAGWHTHLDILSDLLHGRDGRDFWDHFLPLQQSYKDRLEGAA